MTEQGFYFVIVPIIRSEPINEKTSDHTFFITVFNPLCGQEGEIGLKTNIAWPSFSVHVAVP